MPTTDPAHDPAEAVDDGAAAGRPQLPDWLEDCVLAPDDAYARVLHSGMVIGSGLASSEPVTFYAGLWDAVRALDLRDLEIRNGLFLTPHPILVGRADEPVDLPTMPDLPGPFDWLEQIGHRVLGRIDDAVSLKRLADHVEALEERNIVFRSAFLGPALNTFVPDHPVTRRLAPRLAGRNRITAGLVRYQSVHFPDAAAALALDEFGKLTIDLLVQPLTWPQDGRVSFGLSNGVNGEIAEVLLAGADDPDGPHLLVELNRQLPFTTGPGNTYAVEDFRPLAEAGRLTVVLVDDEPPGLPAGEFDDPSEEQLAIATRVADHIEGNLEVTEGRALQVGIGAVSVQVVRQLGDGPWTGRGVTELLDPETYALLENGTIAPPVRCTFAMGEQGTDFHRRLDGDDRIEMEPASTLMLPATFEGALGINNILAVDFAGNINATARDHHPLSGVGGLATIMRGLAVGGIAYLCMRSTHRAPDGEVRSSVMPYLVPGTPVTLTGPDLMGTRGGARILLATEHGIAPLHARPLDEFIRSLVSVAHPDFRDELAAAAWDRYRVRV